MMYKANIPSTNTKSDKKKSPIGPVHHRLFLNLFSEQKGKLILLYGDSVIYKLSLLLAAQTVANGSIIPVIDGCNRFDLHTITRFARERKINPDLLLERIFISRGFTCYQIEAAISIKLPAFIQNYNCTNAIIFGLLDTFYDEQASQREVQQILQRLLKQFKELRADGISLLLSCTNWTVLSRERNQLFSELKASADKVFYLEASSTGNPQLFLEQNLYTATRLGE